MIESVEIKNFKGFQHVHLNGLDRFNFLVGESGSGKTALMDALFLGAGFLPDFFIRT